MPTDRLNELAKKHHHSGKLLNFQTQFSKKLLHYNVPRSGKHLSLNSHYFK